ncbi:MAG: type I methionyl aminopeptidase [Deltaproteobacteria bacterium]|nr:type I methionyl aminopeptidase [Deltaproteobacteria bacterium]
MVVLKTRAEIEKMEAANRIVAKVLAAMAAEVAPGVPTLRLDEIARGICGKEGVKPAFLGYRGFPFAVCVSVNDEVVHGFPSKRKLAEGDIVSMDFGVLAEGFYGDSAVTVPVGEVSAGTGRLLAATEEALAAGIAAAVPGNRLSDIGHAVQTVAEGAGFSVVRKFVGHGIGRELHEDPQIPNYGPPGKGLRLKEGMTLAIEPMVNAGGCDVRILEDGWTAVTSDGSLSAHFEHTVAILENGPRVLSAPVGSG